MPPSDEARRLTEATRLDHLSHMPLGLVGQEWEPGGREFEKARTSTARALTRLSKVKVTADQVYDWEVRSWLREKHYGDASMAGLLSAVSTIEFRDIPVKPPRDLFSRGGSDAE